MKQENTQEQLQKLLLEAKAYYGYQKEYLRLTMAEQLTKVLGAIAVAVVCGVLAFVILLFLGIAFAHWIGEAIGNMGLCYAIFAAIIALLLLIFYLNRRKIVILPLARLMSEAFLSVQESNHKEENDHEAESDI